MHLAYLGECLLSKLLEIGLLWMIHTADTIPIIELPEGLVFKF